MNIGQRLRSLRKSKGLSLGDVQERTGMHGSHLSRVETGRIVPSLETLQRWAWALDAELYQFFLEDGQPVAPGATKGSGKSARLLDSREERLLDLFGRMAPRNQDLILSLAESVDRHLPKDGDAGHRRGGPRLHARFPPRTNGSRAVAKLPAAETKASLDTAVLTQNR
jgi:transcriptional regulator with XRE-family HTH domain